MFPHMSKLQLLLMTFICISCGDQKTIIENKAKTIKVNSNPFVARSVSNSSSSFKYADSPELYYGEDFNLLNKNTISQKKILKKLSNILNLTHIETDGFDKFSETCPNSSKCYKYQAYTYRDVRKYLFGTLYLEKKGSDNFVTDKYCDYRYQNDEIVDGIRVRLTRDFYPNGEIINTEHLWPQSRFDDLKKEQSHAYSDSDKKNDLHHLLPTDPLVNATRAAFYFGEIEEIKTTLKCQRSQMGKAFGVKYNNKNDSYFEPPQEIKGDIARALMYMSVRYEMFITDKEEAFIRKWHKEDPVTIDEIKRNNLIHKYQGTRNPFIDYPHLESLITNF